MPPVLAECGETSKEFFISYDSLHHIEKHCPGAKRYRKDKEDRKSVDLFLAEEVSKGSTNFFCYYPRGLSGDGDDFMLVKEMQL